MKLLTFAKRLVEILHTSASGPTHFRLQFTLIKLSEPAQNIVIKGLHL